MIQAHAGLAREVDLDGDGLALHQPPHASQLVEQLLGGGQKLASVSGAPGDRHGGSRRIARNCAGRSSPKPAAPAPAMNPLLVTFMDPLSS
jgi:hypothetical protein